MIFFQIFIQIFRNLTFLLAASVDIFSSGLFYNIYIAHKLSVFTDREMKRRDLFAVKLCQLFHDLTIADIINIHFCYKEHTRKIVFLT